MSFEEIESEGMEFEHENVYSSDATVETFSKGFFLIGKPSSKVEADPSSRKKIRANRSQTSIVGGSRSCDRVGEYQKPFFYSGNLRWMLIKFQDRLEEMLLFVQTQNRNCMFPMDSNCIEDLIQSGNSLLSNSKSPTRLNVESWKDDIEILYGQCFPYFRDEIVTKDREIVLCFYNFCNLLKTLHEYLNGELNKNGNAFQKVITF